MLEFKPGTESFQNPHCNLVPWSPSSALSPPLLAPSFSIPPGNLAQRRTSHCLRSRPWGREQTQGTPASVIPSQTAWPHLAKPREGQGPPKVHSSPFPSRHALCLLQVRVCPSFQGLQKLIPRSKPFSEHHHLSPLHPEAKPLSVAESRVLRLPGDHAVPAPREAGSGSTHLACLGPGPA